MQTPSPGNSRYFAVFKDDHSGWCEVKFLQNKSDVFNHFQQFTNTFQRQHNVVIRTLRTDNGGECIGKEFED